MDQMDNNNTPGAGPANSHSASHSPHNNSRTFAAHANSSEGEQEAPSLGPRRFRISVPGNMHLNVSDAPPRNLEEDHASSRALFGRPAGTDLAKDPTTVYSQRLNSCYFLRSNSAGSYWNLSGGASNNGSTLLNRGHSGLQAPVEAPSGNDWGQLWGPQEAEGTHTAQESAQLNRTRNRRNAASVPLQYRTWNAPEAEVSMGYGFTTATSLGSTSGSDP